MATANTTFSPYILRQGIPYQNNVEVCAASGAITSIAGGHVYLTKAGVGVMTLAAPFADGAELTITSTTANAHTVTITAGLAGAGGGADVLTFGGAIGDSITLTSYGGNWHKKAVINVTAG
jgi:hypothetical protein